MEGRDERIPDPPQRAEIAGAFEDGGRLLDPDGPPRDVVPGRRARRPDGFVTGNGPKVVSDAARQAVEALGPGRHRLLRLALAHRRTA